jgi:hypothetical protein
MASPSSNAGEVTFIAVASISVVVVGLAVVVDAGVRLASSVDDEQAATKSRTATTATR